MVIWVPTSALISFDLPTFGAPISAMNPQRRSSLGSAIEPFRAHSLAREHGRRRSVCGGAFGAPETFGGLAVRQFDRDAELRIMVRTLALDFAIGRRRQPACLRPFLQHGLGIAQWPRRRAHALLP